MNLACLMLGFAIGASTCYIVIDVWQRRDRRDKFEYLKTKIKNRERKKRSGR